MPKVETGHLLDRVADILKQRPAGVVCDIDGTISHIAPRPDAAELAPGARAALTALTERYELVAVVTGRSADNAAVLVDVPNLLVVGNHGLEWIERGQHAIHPEVVPFVSRIGEAMRAIATLAANDDRLAGAVIEDKRLSGSVHYRLTANPEIARELLLERAEQLGELLGLRVTEGRMVIELRPPVHINKGSAIRRLAENYRLAGLIFFGDDVTDIDGFHAVHELRDAERLSGLSVAVADPEARPEVIAAADASVDGVRECVELLAAVARTGA
jgi:trehalose 6-phosphate phosphatase